MEIEEDDEEEENFMTNEEEAIVAMMDLVALAEVWFVVSNLCKTNPSYGVRVSQYIICLTLSCPIITKDCQLQCFIKYRIFVRKSYKITPSTVLLLKYLAMYADVKLKCHNSDFVLLLYGYKFSKICRF